MIDFSEGLDDADFGLVHNLDSANQHGDSKNGSAANDNPSADKAEELQLTAVVLILRTQALAHDGGNDKASYGDESKNNNQNNHFFVTPFLSFCW